ncbi:filament-like plant protein 7 [Phragmites australis]|uniref:filament-like plant protein 7 n=1 Tax=Phragmites australis TaxID=29695 RepID=UPI002D799C41|nr:filament-like plant protein 7 [Phragmites australis]XP_062184925.1 filament-like plant protein 7 [Phragmites australis]
MSEMGDALRSCMEKLLLVREEKERLMIEATNTISSEQNKTRDLQHKFEDASKRLDKVIAENHNLRNTVDSKEKLIKELKESKAYSDQKLTDATAMLEFSQKQCASLKYEVSILQEELGIRNKEREYDLKSIDAAQRHQRESMKKITALEAECQRLRTMVQKRLPGPAALAKMKDEVKRQGTISVENGTRRPCTAAKPLPRARHSVSEGYLVKLQELDDENRYLKQLLTKKESDLQLLHLKYEDEACKLSALQMQLDELSARHESTENNHSEPVGCALASKLEHSRSGKRRASQSRSRRITGSDMQLLVDPLEIEKLEMASRPSSAPHQCVPDVTCTDSKMVVSETVHKDLISDGFSDKYPEWIQDILKVIISKHQVTKISVASILDEVMNALSEISDKGNGAANLPYDRPEIDKMVATLIERVKALIEKCTENNSMSFLSFLHEKSELILRLEHLNHVCSDVLDGKDNLERFIDEVFLILEWMVNQCFVCLDGLGTVGYITNRSDGIESQRTLSIHEKDAMDNAKSEMVLGMQQETQKETVQITEGQIPDEISENHSQIQFTNSKLDEELSAVRQEQGDSCQEKHSVHCEAESGASDGSKEQLAEEDGKQLVTTSAISAAAKKLAECQETITNLSKQLDALQSPTDADALDKEKCDTLPLSVANLVVEADTKPEGFNSPTNEEATRMEENSEPDATEKNLEHEQDSGTGPNAIKSGLSPIGVRVMVPKSPRTSVYVDVKKKKRRASLLSRLVFRKKA